MRRINHSSRFIAQFENSDYMRYSFDDICYDDTKSATKIPASEYLAQGSYPIYDQATDSIIAGYSNDSNGVNMVFPAVLFGDHSRVVKYIDRAFYIGADGVKILRPINADLSTEFLYYQLKFKDVPNTGYNRHFKYLKLFSYCCPNAEEQRAFLAICHQADKSKFSDFKSRFIEMFEATVHAYEEVPIIALCHSEDDIKCGPFGTQLKQSEYQEYGVAVWGIPQINSEFTISPDTFVTTEKAKRLEQFSLIAGDIAMSRKGNVGQCALYPEHFENGIIASDVVRIRVNKDLIEPQFLVYQLHNSHKVRKQILDVSDGSIMAGINVTKLKRIQVYSPPMDMQNQFVNVVKQADKSKYLN